MAKVNELVITNPALIHEATEKAVARVAQEVKRDATRLAPRSPLQPPPKRLGPITGDLKNSIQAVKRNAEEYQVTVGMAYGIYHEFGTRKMMARPFLGPALEKARRKWSQ